MNGYVDKARYLDSDLPLVLSCDTDSFRMSARELKPSQGLIASKKGDVHLNPGHLTSTWVISPNVMAGLVLCLLILGLPGSFLSIYILILYF